MLLSTCPWLEPAALCAPPAGIDSLWRRGLLLACIPACLTLQHQRTPLLVGPAMGSSLFLLLPVSLPKCPALLVPAVSLSLHQSCRRSPAECPPLWHRACQCANPATQHSAASPAISTSMSAGRSTLGLTEALMLVTASKGLYLHAGNLLCRPLNLALNRSRARVPAPARQSEPLRLLGCVCAEEHPLHPAIAKH